MFTRNQRLNIKTKDILQAFVHDTYPMVFPLWNILISPNSYVRIKTEIIQLPNKNRNNKIFVFDCTIDNIEFNSHINSNILFKDKKDTITRFWLVINLYNGQVLQLGGKEGFDISCILEDNNIKIHQKIFLTKGNVIRFDRRSQLIYEIRPSLRSIKATYYRTKERMRFLFQAFKGKLAVSPTGITAEVEVNSKKQKNDEK